MKQKRSMATTVPGRRLPIRLAILVACLMTSVTGMAHAEHALWIAARELGRVVHFDIDRQCVTAFESVAGSPSQLDWDPEQRHLLVSRVGDRLDDRTDPPTRLNGGLLQMDPRRLVRRHYLGGQAVADAARLADGRIVAALKQSLAGETEDAVVVFDRFGYRLLHSWPISRRLDPMQLLLTDERDGSFLIVCRRGTLLWGNVPAGDGAFQPLVAHDLFAFEQPAVTDSSRHRAHSIHFGDVDPMGRAWVPQSDIERTFLVDMANGALSRRDAGSAHHVHAVAADAERLYVAERALGAPYPNSWLSAFDLESLEPLYRQPLDSTGHQAVICERHERLWMTTNDGLLQMFATSSGVLLDQYDIGGSLFDVVLVDDDAPPTERGCLDLDDLPGD